MKVLHFTQFNEFCLPKEALISGAKEIGLELDLIEMDIDKEGITNLLEAPRIENLDAVLVSSYRRSKNQIQTAEDLPKLFGDYLYRYAYTNTIVLVNSDNSSQSHRPTGNFTNLHPLDPLQESEDHDTECQGWWQPVINNHPLFEGNPKVDTEALQCKSLLKKGSGYGESDVCVVAQWWDNLPMMGIRRNSGNVLVITLGFETENQNGLRVVLNALRLKTANFYDLKRETPGK